MGFYRREKIKVYSEPKSIDQDHSPERQLGVAWKILIGEHHTCKDKT